MIRRIRLQNPAWAEQISEEWKGSGTLDGGTKVMLNWLLFEEEVHLLPIFLSTENLAHVKSLRLFII